MARIRSVKPDFFTHPHIVACSIPARLLLESLWCQADDSGRLRDQPLRIRALSFGEADDVDVPALLAELAAADRIERYAVDGDKYIECKNFREHQHPQKPTASKLPAPLGSAIDDLECSRDTPYVVLPIPLSSGVGIGVGRGGDVGEPDPQAAPRPNPIEAQQAIARQFDLEIRAVYPPSRIGDHLEALSVYGTLAQAERDLAGRNLAGWIRHASWQTEQVRFVKGLTKWLTDGSWKEPPPRTSFASTNAVPTPADLAKLKARRLAGKYHLTPDQEKWLARDVTILDADAEDGDLAAAVQEAVPFEPAATAAIEPEVEATLSRIRRTAPAEGVA